MTIIEQTVRLGTFPVFREADVKIIVQSSVNLELTTPIVQVVAITGGGEHCPMMARSLLLMWSEAASESWKSVVVN